MTFLVAITIILLCLVVGGVILYFHSRKLLREQKNFERGLKMVPLLIHLPPLSEDTEGAGRDVRDLIDENISKAQVMYSIIASTLKKGFKSKFYGQRHFSFEIIGSHGFVQFYAAVPVTLVEVVKQAVVSAYPSARLEEVAEHNIFSPVGRISGTVGGELTLKSNFAYPIATYQEVKRDGMQSLLNALATLDKEDGVGIQILMRPAEGSWRKKASTVASKKRKGKGEKKGPEAIFGQVGQLFGALAKPPEAKSKEGSPGKDLSNTEQAMLDAIDDKTRHPGYEVLIRVVASSNILQRSQALLNNVVAAFSLFDAPGKNGFKYTPSKDIEHFVTSFILRFFPQEINQNVLNSVELATIFHFPDQKNIPTSQLSRQESKQVDGPRNMSEDGLLLGYNIFRSVKKPIRLSLEDRRRHMYIVGQTGVGKSILLENIALQDMIAGRGFAFVDPHGDTAERLLSMVPRERTEDVIYFCPADMDYPMGLNLFEFHDPTQKDFLIQEAINMLYKLYDPQHQGIIGPRYENWFRNAALTLMSDPEGSTFIDVPKVFTDNKYAKQKLKFVTDKTVLDFWNGEMAQTSDYHKSEVLGWFVSKFGAFLSNEMMRNIIGQTKSAFNLRDIMDNKKILLVNLSKGRTGDLNSKLLGMVFIMKFQAAAMSRANIPEAEREDFSLYVDEFQNFSTDSFATILSEARKYRLNLIVANQFTTQLTDEIRDAVFGNVGSIVSFRVGADADADALSKKFQPIFDRNDILRLPNYNTVTQILIGGVPTQPFSMATIPPLGTPNEELGKALKQLSAAKYGRPKAVVESEIFARLTTKEEPKPAFGSPVGSPFGGSPFGAAPAVGGSPFGAGAAGVAPPSSGSSFLDEWLAKRRTPGGTAPAASSFAAPPTNPAGSAFPVQSPAGLATPSLAGTTPASAAPVTSAIPPATTPWQPLGASLQSTAPLVATKQPVANPTPPLTASTPPSISHVQSMMPPGLQPIDPSQLTAAAPTAGVSAFQPGVTATTPQLVPFDKTNDGAANISSGEREKEEVSAVAEELREELKKPGAGGASKPAPASESEVHLGKTTPASPHTEDTIYIDNDGNFKTNET